MEKKKKSMVLIGGIVVVLVAIIGVLLFLLLKKAEPEKEEAPSVYTINEANYQQIREDMDAEVREGYFETYMKTEWTFSDGTSETTDAVLGNSPNNTKPIRCEIQLAETGQVVFATGVLPVGTQVPPFKLDVDLDPGTYSAVCMVYLLNEAEDGTYTDYSSAGFNVTITVEG